MAERAKPARRRVDDPDATVEIRSYRNVFALERRLYRIDGLPLNPAGVPLRGIAYFAVLLAVAMAARTLPPVSLVPWYVGNVLAPAALAFLLCSVRIDGRPFHLVAPVLFSHSLFRGGRGLGGAKPSGAARAMRERDRRLLVISRRGAVARLDGRASVVLAGRRSVLARRGRSGGARGAAP
jgi:hypothetical protein